MTARVRTVAGLLREQRRRGAHPLLICDTGRIGYADAERRSAELARGLVALGAGKGTHVGLLFPNGVEFVVTMLAAARIGAVVVPFSTFQTAAELRDQLRASDVRIMLSAGMFRSHDYVTRLTEVVGTDIDQDTTILSTAVPALRHVIFDLDRLSDLAGTVGRELLAGLEDDTDGCDPLAIVYTSGSTGAPKGAVHTQAGLLEHQRNLNTIRGLTVADRLFCNSPFFWIGGFAFALLATLVAGSTLICSNATDAADVMDLLEAEKPTITNGFSAGIAHLTRHRSYSARTCTARRGNLYPVMAVDTRPADPELRHNMLGMTEAGSVVLICGDETDQPESRRGSYGRPAPGFAARIVDPETGTDAAVGAYGELWLRGKYLMDRYYGRSREECFDADGWLHTGDLFRTDDDGLYYFIARAGSMIKTAGANVTPAEVEKAIAGVTGGITAVVLGLPDTERGQIVAAVLVLDDNTDIDEDQVRRALRSELSAYKVPRRFTACPRSELPLLSSGKVDLPALARLFDV